MHHVAHNLTAFDGDVGALVANWLACLAFSAFCRTVEVSSSMLEAVSSRLEACFRCVATDRRCPARSPARRSDRFGWSRAPR